MIFVYVHSFLDGRPVITHQRQWRRGRLGGGAGGNCLLINVNLHSENCAQMFTTVFVMHVQCAGARINRLPLLCIVSFL